MSNATYEFDYAMRRLRDAIDYAEQERDFQEARIWANRVEEAYNADLEAERELTANANEGAKLLYSLAVNGESSHPVTDMQITEQAIDAQLRVLNLPQIDTFADGYAFNQKRAQIENDTRAQLAKEYNALFK